MWRIAVAHWQELIEDMRLSLRLFTVFWRLKNDACEVAAVARSYTGLESNVPQPLAAFLNLPI
jgi:hypothetical protein